MLEDKIETWVVGVNLLDGFARAFPQTDYDGLKMSLQQECKFFQGVTPWFGLLFAPLEAELMG